MAFGGRHIALLLTLSLCGILACSPTVRYQVLSALFDGVPPPARGQQLTVGVDTLNQADSARLLAVMAVHTPRYQYHDPYVKKECNKCHSEQHMGRMVADEPQMCYNCHENRARHRYKHGPAGAGYCSACHEPHKSGYNNLLLADGNNLCFSCHEQSTIAQDNLHRNQNPRTKCVDCHNAHSSENHGVLQSGACYSCHDKKISQNKYMHGPVAGNYCATCHQRHDSPARHLLLAEGNNLCLGCHQDTRAYSTPEHNEGQKMCTDCHNPHGSDREFMLD